MSDGFNLLQRIGFYHLNSSLEKFYIKIEKKFYYNQILSAQYIFFILSDNDGLDNVGGNLPLKIAIELNYHQSITYGTCLQEQYS